MRNAGYITNPENKMQIRENDIANLKKMYCDFNFANNNGHYIFTFKNLNIIISKRGHIQLALVSTQELSEALALLGKIADKINSILGIKEYSRKVMT